MSLPARQAQPHPMLTSLPIEVDVIDFRPADAHWWVGHVVARRRGRQLTRVAFRIPASQSAAAVLTARTAALCFLLPAMRLRVPLRVHGGLDARTIANLHAWQQYTAGWSRGRLAPVPIEAATVDDMGASTSGHRTNVLMAFSGGVDSCFTLWRHREAAHSDAVVRAGLMVHGFDIPLDQAAGFDRAVARSRRMLEAHGARAWRIETDIRRLERAFRLDWEREAHGIFLAACLSTHEGSADALMIASTYPATSPRLPWGSNAVTDPLLGGPRAVVHDGVASNKWQKVAAFAHDEVLQQQVRVCWEGMHVDRNCGRCFKCLTTFAAFQLAGVDEPAAFPVETCRARLRTLRLATPQNVDLVQSMMREAQAQGRTALAAELEVALRRSALTPVWWMRATRAGRRCCVTLRRHWCVDE